MSPDEPISPTPISDWLDKVGHEIKDAILGPDSVVPKAEAEENAGQQSLRVVPPSEVTQLRATGVTARSVSLAWKAPATGSRPIRYTVFFRVHGTSTWNIAALTSSTSAVISPLKPATEYEFEVAAQNN